MSSTMSFSRSEGSRLSLRIARALRSASADISCSPSSAGSFPVSRKYEGWTPNASARATTWLTIGFSGAPALDPPDHLFGKIPEAHAGYLGVGVGLPRPLVLDSFEEVVQQVGDAPLSGRLFDPGRAPDPISFPKPQFGREVHGLLYRLELLEAGVLDLPFSHHAHVRTGNYPARGVLELLAVPPTAVRMTVGLQE